MAGIDIVPLATEALDAFSEIAHTAEERLRTSNSVPTNSLATGNTYNNSKATDNLNSIAQSERDGLQRLCKEPTIARIIIEAEDGRQRTVYISRESSLPLGSRREFASYRSAIGRFAELEAGEGDSVKFGGREQRYTVIEKATFRPELDSKGWDSSSTLYSEITHGVHSINSLRAFLQETNYDGEELDLLLEKAEKQSSYSSGISHEVRTAMGLRDQPILDKFQGEIFRLPIDSQLLILGPPGTGKTTTLIKRLGQKRDVENLGSEERFVINKSDAHLSHPVSWLMFTPSDLLKHYLKEAFNREQVPASDENIKTWVSFRNDIARNKLGILRTAAGGRYILKSDSTELTSSVVENAEIYFESFSASHEARLKNHFKSGIAIVAKAADDQFKEVLDRLKGLCDGIESKDLIAFYRDLEQEQEGLREALKESKAVAQGLMREERNLMFNKNKEIFEEIAAYISSLQQENELDDEELFDDDEEDETVAPNRSAILNATKTYSTAIRSLARYRFLGRTMPKTSLSNSVIDFLGSAIPADDVLLQIGRHISFQNGLRRFVNSHKRLVKDITVSFHHFRRDNAIQSEFYLEKRMNPTHISDLELDAIVLLTLKNTRRLLSQRFVAQDRNDSRFDYLAIIAQLFRNQIMVDEATDFSVLQLACMESLTSLQTKSFFACGDFNQRITSTGIRQKQQLSWISPNISIRVVELVYRQSRLLNEFSSELLKIQGGDLSAIGKLPEHSNHQGVSPVLIEEIEEEDVARWISERIKEVEHSASVLPTIAVLVNSEQEVKPMAKMLTNYLEEMSLSAVACEEGKSLGEGTDIRVFDIKHIKGLEFEAVFFVDIDELAQEQPDLFDRFLYVGATRAATYLGLTCKKNLPDRLEPLRTKFTDVWEY